MEGFTLTTKNNNVIGLVVMQYYLSHVPPSISTLHVAIKLTFAIFQNIDCHSGHVFGNKSQLGHAKS